MAWLTTAQLLGRAGADSALRRWSGTPAGARTLVEARTLGAYSRAMLEHIARCRPIARLTLEVINALLARPIGHGELVRARHGFRRRPRFALCALSTFSCR